MAAIKSYRDLQVWQRAVELAVLVYRHTAAFPKSELYGLTHQMRRASVSVASNIAEGFGRSANEFSHYLEMSRGSLAELETLLELASRLYSPRSTSLERVLGMADEVGKMLRVIQQRLEAKLPRP